MSPGSFHLTAAQIGIARSEQDSLRRFHLKIDEVDIHAGDRIALCGPNGSGKTTALSVLSLILPATSADCLEYKTPDGAVAFTFPLSGEGRRRARYLQRRTISVVQHAGTEVPFLKVRDRVKARLMLAGRATTGAGVMRILDRMGLSALADARPAELSQGQRQRLSLATAIAAPGSVLFADEPTAALDQDWSELAMSILSGLAREAGIAVVMSTHDPETARRYGFSVISPTSLETDADKRTISRFARIGT